MAARIAQLQRQMADTVIAKIQYRAFALMKRRAGNP